MKRVSNRAKSKQIVHLVRRYHPMIGGVEKHLENLNKELIKRRHRITVITEKSTESLENYEVINGVRVIRLPISSENPENKFFQKLNFKFKIWKSIWKNKQILDDADVIQIHDVFFWILPFWVFYRTKMHITFHGYEGNKKPKRSQVLWHRMAAKLTRNNLCIGGFHQKWFKIDPGEISFGAVEKFDKIDKVHSRKKIKKIMYIGRLHEDTGIMEYLRAFKKLQQNNSNLSLDIYGDGPQREEAEKYARNNKLNTKFHGFIKNASDYISEYDLIFASRYLGIIEALSAAKPVIAFYDNEIKKDYLKISPFEKWIKIAGNHQEIADAAINSKNIQTADAKKWADAQTWSKLADVYEGLWI